MLKIDRSFVEGLSRHREDVEVAAAVISLAHALGVRVVAEGVESEEQFTRLRDLGCYMAQGNYFAAVLPRDGAFAPPTALSAGQDGTDVQQWPGGP